MFSFPRKSSNLIDQVFCIACSLAEQKIINVRFLKPDRAFQIRCEEKAEIFEGGSGWVNNYGIPMAYGVGGK